MWLKMAIPEIIAHLEHPDYYDRWWVLCPAAEMNLNRPE